MIPFDSSNHGYVTGEIGKDNDVCCRSTYVLDFYSVLYLSGDHGKTSSERLLFTFGGFTDLPPIGRLSPDRNPRIYVFFSVFWIRQGQTHRFTRSVSQSASNFRLFSWQIFLMRTLQPRLELLKAECGTQDHAGKINFKERNILDEVAVGVVDES